MDIYKVCLWKPQKCVLLVLHNSIIVSEAVELLQCHTQTGGWYVVGVNNKLWKKYIIVQTDVPT